MQSIDVTNHHRYDSTSIKLSAIQVQATEPF